jgi:hypothetical protein
LVDGECLPFRAEAERLHRHQAASGLQPGAGERTPETANIVPQTRSKALAALTVQVDGSRCRRNHRHRGRAAVPPRGALGCEHSNYWTASCKNRHRHCERLGQRTHAEQVRPCEAMEPK